MSNGMEPTGTYEEKNLWNYQPIICTRKKNVTNAYKPNSNRIFQDEITDKSQDRRAQTAGSVDGSPSTRTPRGLANNPAGMNFSLSRSDPSSYWARSSRSNANQTQSIETKPGFIKNHPREPSRRNCPHPNSAGFLRSNVRMLNDAIPKVATDSMQNDQTGWWYHTFLDKNNNRATFNSISKDELNKRGALKNSSDNETAGRSLFRKNGSNGTKGNGVDKTNLLSGPKSNPYNLPKIERRKQPATTDWILRHNTCDDKKFLEHISYRHGYNRRFYKHEPIRGKLPGNFVWKELKSE